MDLNSRIIPGTVVIVKDPFTRLWWPAIVCSRNDNPPPACRIIKPGESPSCWFKYVIFGAEKESWISIRLEKVHESVMIFPSSNDTSASLYEIHYKARYGESALPRLSGSETSTSATSSANSNNQSSRSNTSGKKTKENEKYPPTMFSQSWILAELLSRRNSLLDYVIKNLRIERKMSMSGLYTGPLFVSRGEKYPLSHIYLHGVMIRGVVHQPSQFVFIDSKKIKFTELEQTLHQQTFRDEFEPINHHDPSRYKIMFLLDFLIPSYTTNSSSNNGTQKFNAVIRKTSPSGKGLFDAPLAPILSNSPESEKPQDFVLNVSTQAAMSSGSMEILRSEVAITQPDSLPLIEFDAMYQQIEQSIGVNNMIVRGIILDLVPDEQVQLSTRPNVQVMSYAQVSHYAIHSVVSKKQAIDVLKYPTFPEKLRILPEQLQQVFATNIYTPNEFHVNLGFFPWQKSNQNESSANQAASSSDNSNSPPQKPSNSSTSNLGNKNDSSPAIVPSNTDKPLQQNYVSSASAVPTSSPSSGTKPSPVVQSTSSQHLQVKLDPGFPSNSNRLFTSISDGVNIHPHESYKGLTKIGGVGIFAKPQFTPPELLSTSTQMIASTVPALEYSDDQRQVKSRRRPSHETNVSKTQVIGGRSPPAVVTSSMMNILPSSHQQSISIQTGDINQKPQLQIPPEVPQRLAPPVFDGPKTHYADLEELNSLISSRVKDSCPYLTKSSIVELVNRFKGYGWIPVQKIHNPNLDSDITPLSQAKKRRRF
jgi:hypothetical protein